MVVVQKFIMGARETKSSSTAESKRPPEMNHPVDMVVRRPREEKQYLSSVNQADKDDAMNQVENVGILEVTDIAS